MKQIYQIKLMKKILIIALLAALTLFVTFAPIAVYKHVTRAQQQLVQQTVEEYEYTNDSTTVYNIYSEQKYLDN